MKAEFWKETLRIAIAAAIGFWAVDRVQLSTALNLLMFFLIYLAVAFALEGIFKLVKKLKK